MNARQVSLEVLNQRKAICAACEFSTRCCNGESVCSIWGCRWRTAVRRKDCRCALGNREFPGHLHQTAKW